MPTSAIKNLLIDLGGVLYEIDIDKTLTAYRALQAADTQPLDLSKHHQAEWFSLLDIGQTDIDAFARGMQQTFQLQADLPEIKRIWLDLLIGVLPGRIEQIRALAQHYQLALLSNTSRFHYEFYEEACRPMFQEMKHLFFSFDMGLRKPDPAIYQTALREAGWKAEETLFLDDSRTNIEAAAQEGIQTAWIEQHEDFDAVVRRLLG
jgi:putative hydrolase of the HAD superfamily